MLAGSRGSALIGGILSQSWQVIGRELARWYSICGFTAFPNYPPEGLWCEHLPARGAHARKKAYALERIRHARQAKLQAMKTVEGAGAKVAGVKSEGGETSKLVSSMAGRSYGPESQQLGAEAREHKIRNKDTRERHTHGKRKPFFESTERGENGDTSQQCQVGLTRVVWHGAEQSVGLVCDFSYQTCGGRHRSVTWPCTAPIALECRHFHYNLLSLPGEKPNM